MIERHAGRADAVARIAASRASIARELAAGGRAASKGDVATPASRSLARWALDAVDAGVLTHPVQAGVRMACAAALGGAAPLARAPTWALVGTALLAGTLIAVMRPWRRLLKPVALAGAIAQMLVQALVRMPARPSRPSADPL